jgi:transcriptional regulator with XRE-family HTH domain
MRLTDMLAALRKKGLTQRQIAAELGCSQPTVSDLAAGKIGGSRPSYKIVSGLQRLAQKYGVQAALHPVSA